jgi:hypothetical protein
MKTLPSASAPNPSIVSTNADGAGAADSSGTLISIELLPGTVIVSGCALASMELAAAPSRTV